MKKGHFRLTCVAQKRCCLSSLIELIHPHHAPTPHYHNYHHHYHHRHYHHCYHFRHCYYYHHHQQQQQQVDILNSASRILQCWSYYVKINFARHQHDTRKNPKQSGIEAIDSCFTIIIVHQFGVTKELCWKISCALWFKQQLYRYQQ